MRRAALFYALRLIRASATHPFRLLLIVGSFCIALGSGSLYLRVQVDADALVPEADPLVLTDLRLRRGFGLGDPILILVSSQEPDGALSVGALRAVAALTSHIQAGARELGVSVVSLATERRPRVEPGTLRFRLLLDPFPDTPELLDLVRADIKQIGLLTGTLLAIDRSTAVVVVRLPVPSELAATSERFRARDAVLSVASNAILQAKHHCAGQAAVPVCRISSIGPPVAGSLLGVRVLEDVARLMPITAALVAIIAWIRLRSVAAVAFISLKSLASCFVTLGFMGWVGIPLQITTAILPVILVGVSISDEVFVLTRFQSAIQGGGRAVRPRSFAFSTVKSMAVPSIATSLMMIIGFASLAASPIRAISHFGVAGAFGLLFCGVWTLAATPALLRAMMPFLARPLAQRSARAQSAEISRPRGASRLILALSLAAVLGFVGVGFSKIVVQDSWTEAFAKSDPLRLDTERANRTLSGTDFLLVFLRWEPSENWPRIGEMQGPMLDPVTLRAVDAFEQALRETPSVGGTLGPGSSIKSVHRLFLAGVGGSWSIPKQPARVVDVYRAFDLVRGRDRRLEVVSEDFHSAAIMVLVRDADFETSRRLIEVARQLATSILPAGTAVDFGGNVAVSSVMIRSLVEGQATSAMITIVGVAAAVLFCTGSIATALLVGMVCVAASALLFASFGWIGITLGVATSMILGISIGIGSDFAVYYLHGLSGRRDLGFKSLNELAAWRPLTSRPTPSHASNVRAVVTDTLAIAGGFAVLTLSQIPSVAILGISVAATVLLCATLTLFVLPRIVDAWSARE